MTPSPSETIEPLAALARAFDPERFSARVVRGYARPFLRVISLEATSLTERITVRPDESGTPYFWWSWNERVGPVRDIPGAARKITTVLGPVRRAAGAAEEPRP
ncbi:hypothetical protein [Sphaerisporangium perillae]|uniref:hypothetical protein n=1 Tax=Sphaerisporangium perillae TaxID=2935860 RepID=UPI002010BE41|nr:hypothetical protein [Sphaerisporangium perillae]